MRKKFHAKESLWYKGVATFSCGGKTTDSNFQFSMILQEICCFMAASTASECMCSMAVDVVNSRRNLRSSSMNYQLLLKSSLKSEKKALKFN